MKWINKLERRYGRFAIAHLTMQLIIAQVAVFILHLFQEGFLSHLYLAGELVYGGQVWRLLTFMFMPPGTEIGGLGLLMIIIAWFIMYISGTALEERWGHFKFTLYILIGWILTALSAFIVPGVMIPNFFLVTSIFIAFAALFPDFEFLLFFVLPVKVKWLALIEVLIFAYAFYTKDWGVKLAVLAATITLLLFFSGDMINRMKQIQRKRAFDRKMRE